MASSYAALVSLMRLIHDLEHHPSPPISLDKRLLDSIAQLVAYFEEFLRSYISPPPVANHDDEEEAADPLEMRIAAAAHAAEDAIEYLIVDCVKQKNRNKKEAANDDDEKIKSINRCYCILQIAIEEMDSIKKALLAMADTHKERIKVPVVRDDQVAVRKVNETLVGSDGVLLEIMEKLAGGQIDRQVIPIVGMGGIGKTFLAKTIYAKPLIKERFDICAWATISQQYNTREILCELLSQATNTNKEQLSVKSVDELGLELHKCLFSRRFLIVMDDMWSIDLWDKIQRFFPDNGNGSRVLVTTRLSQLSLQLNNNDYSLRMSFLDKASSWDLFSKTVFGEKISCPPELKGIGGKIVDSCRGLPLSIVVVGGLLRKMDSTRGCWESVRDNLTSVMNTENDKHCLRLLKLSYNHLPIYLKPCFLYMGVFEEDEEIHVSKLVHLWISEGFLKPTNGEALATTARGFLQDLVDRNLVLIGKLGPTGSIKSCKIHDSLRDMCLKEGKKDGFYHVIGQCNNPPCTQRRVVVPKKASKENVRGVLMSSMRYTRSIICEHGEVPLCRNLGLLKTLHSRKIDFFGHERHVNSLLSCYVNLRHLSIDTSGVSSFLSSVGLLWNLHTVIVYRSCEPTLITDFWAMHQLRHVEFVHDCVRLPDPRNCDDDAVVVVMENLHTLKGVRNLKVCEGVVKRIPNIKKLKLIYDGFLGTKNLQDEYFLGNIKSFGVLESLSVTFFFEHERISYMQKLITFPLSLKKLSLCTGTDFEWDDVLESIGSLPLLEKLRLWCGCFGKREWETVEGRFLRLKSLVLQSCRGLENWTAEEERSNILPRLQHLRLFNLLELKKIPYELGNIDTLKSIELIYCGEGAVKSAKEVVDEQVELQGEVSFHVNVKVDGDHLCERGGR